MPLGIMSNADVNAAVSESVSCHDGPVLAVVEVVYYACRGDTAFDILAGPVAVAKIVEGFVEMLEVLGEYLCCCS